MPASPTTNGDGLLADDVKAHLCANTSPASGMATTDTRYPKWYGCGIVDADKALIDIPPPPPADQLIAGDDTGIVAEDGTTDIAVLANDSDPDGGAISVTGVDRSGARHAPRSTPTGRITYTPDPDYNGSDTFDYTIANGAADTATGTVSMTITPVNDAPLAVADSLVTATDTAAGIAVLANDTDVDGDPLTVTAVSTPSHGTAGIGPDGSITYPPVDGFAGNDSFTYDISDGAGGTATGVVSVSVISNNSPADRGRRHRFHDGGHGDDGGPGRQRHRPRRGAPGGDRRHPAGPRIDDDRWLGPVVYTPAADYHGPDAFTYTVADQIGATDSGAVTVSVSPANDDPDATNDDATTDEDTWVDIDVTGNDTDIDGDPLSVTSVAAPALGSAALQPDGTIRYTPLANYYGADSFGYTVSDGAGGTDTATVSITVTAVNDVPVAVAKSVTTAYQTAATVTMSGSDVETCDLTFQVVTPPAHGTVGAPSNVLCVTLLPPYADSSKIVYTPTAGYSGPGFVHVSDVRRHGLERPGDGGDHRDLTNPRPRRRPGWRPQHQVDLLDRDRDDPGAQRGACECEQCVGLGHLEQRRDRDRQLQDDFLGNVHRIQGVDPQVGRLGDVHGDQHDGARRRL